LHYRQACELHLQATISSAPSEAAIEHFLSAGGSSSDTSTTNDNASSSSTRLFVWIPRTQSKSSTDGTDALASTQVFDGNNHGALAFINTNSGSGSNSRSSTSDGGESKRTEMAITSVSQIQCMTLAPRIYPSVVEDTTSSDTVAESTSTELVVEEEKTNTNPGSQTFLALQLYARHCFVPAVQAMEAAQDGSGVSMSTLLEDTKTDGPDGTMDAMTSQALPSSSNKKKSRVLEGLEDKLRELDVALGQCRRNTLGQIPHITLAVHPMIRDASTHIPLSGKIDLDHLGLGDKLSDDAFLNEVQTGVNSWISQIRKVTVLPTTTSFPDATSEESEQNADLEEVSFWTTLEIALKHIRAELTKADVLLTLSLLKNAKRFVATIALENNTGLDAAVTHTTDICNFLRGYPIQALAAARDWNKIGTSMEGLFLHLPKIRQSRFYDLERCVKLLEASTLTLRQRLDATLKEKYKANGIVLNLSFEDYESDVYGPTQDIFVQFDTLYDQFVEFILEQGRKRRVSSGDSTKTPAQIVKDVTLYHQPLRERLDAIHHFRTQHEKLRVVVTEVLMGEQSKEIANTKKSAVLDGIGSLKEGFSATNAIRDVEGAPISLFAAIDVLDLSQRGSVAFSAALEGYERKIDAIEERLAKLLRDKLTACQVRVGVHFDPSIFNKSVLPLNSNSCI
jgi:hypothetical protein